MVPNPMIKFRKPQQDPNMTDATLMLNVEDLIQITFGNAQSNIINFKLLQIILEILAGKMCLLQQDIEIRFSEEADILTELKKECEEGVLSEPGSEEEEVKEDEKVRESKGKKRGGRGARGGKFDTGDEKSPKQGDVRGRKKRKRGKADDSLRKRTSRGSLAGSDSQTRVESIEVVRMSQFNILEAMVERLLKRTGGVPLPTMPSNEELLAELSKGTASLPDTMGAMQINARVRAVEHAITKMAGLLTYLASSGALPPDVALIIAAMQKDLQQLALTTGIEPEAINPMVSVATDAHSASSTGKENEKGVPVIPSQSSVSVNGDVTHAEMHEALDAMRSEILKNLDALTAKCDSTADQGSIAAKAVVEKMDYAFKLDNRITTIVSSNADYYQQVQGFDAGLTLQLQNFREQIGQIHTELSVGLRQLEAASSNAESAALIDLKTNYDNLLLAYDHTRTTHASLTLLQKDLSVEVKNLVECVELLREEKADRDEVADALRDKANMSRLNGLLRQKQFEKTRKDLQQRLDLSYDKFHKQEQVWMTAIKDIKDTIASKTNIEDLLCLKDTTIQTLNELLEFLRKLEFALGEPKTALLTRKLARDGAGAPGAPGAEPASTVPVEKRSSTSPNLALPRDPNEEDSCVPCSASSDVETRKHVCNRWVGGSHTLLTEHITREHASPTLVPELPTRQYTGVGTDGHLYLLDEELQPCVECNKISREDAPPPSVDGGGDMF